MNKVSGTSEYAPVVVFAYNRPDHLEKTLLALSQCDLAEDTSVFIYVDGPRTVEDGQKQQKIHHLIGQCAGFRDIRACQREENFGLTKNLTEGISEVIQSFGNIIVLEDDIVVSPYFLKYMNAALKHYEDKKKVWHISGWNFPVDTTELPETFLWRSAMGWGWATWYDRWRHFRKNPSYLIQTWDEKKIQEFNLYGAYDFWEQIEKNASGELNTWAVFWYATIFENSGLCLNPAKALTANIGFDGSGTHSAGVDYRQRFSATQPVCEEKFPVVLQENNLALGRIIALLKVKNVERQQSLSKAARELKKLLKKIVKNSVNTTRLLNKKVYVFGVSELSDIIVACCQNHDVEVCGFLVSDVSNTAASSDRNIFLLSSMQADDVDVIINCIEGIHEVSVSNIIKNHLPTVDIISWTDI